MPSPTITGPLLLWAEVPSSAPVVTPSPYTLVALAGYMAGIFLLGTLAHQLLKRGAFVKEYFLGDRKLNAWVLSLTYVATSVSAGSFVGFPSLIYTYGWVMALWIAGYMVTGLVSKGALAKRLNQVSRFSGAITVPDVLRDRFQSPALGMLAGSFLFLFLIFNLVAQFKAGGLIMQQAFQGVADTQPYQACRQTTADAITTLGMWDSQAAAAKPAGFYGVGYPDYILGIIIFSITVVAYTTYGGFWAVTWIDVLQGLMIVAGALLLMFLALHQVGGLSAATVKLKDMDPRLLTGPGPENFVTPNLAISYFLLWTLGSMGQPVGMVRLMACPDTRTLRRSLFLITVFYALIYLPLVIAFVCARALYPQTYLGHSDMIVPAMAVNLTADWPVLGGLILAATCSAAMSAVAGYLLLMSSSFVRDIYQRSINPGVTPRTVRRLSYATTAAVGIVVSIGAFWAPEFLQSLIILTGAGMACTFLGPVVLGLYWRRTTRPGAICSLLSGFGTVALLWCLGFLLDGKFAPVYLLGLDPFVIGLAVSFAAGILVSWLTIPPPAEHVDRYFLAAEGAPE